MIVEPLYFKSVYGYAFHTKIDRRSYRGTPVADAYFHKKPGGLCVLMVLDAWGDAFAIHDLVFLEEIEGIKKIAIAKDIPFREDPTTGLNFYGMDKELANLIVDPVKMGIVCHFVITKGARFTPCTTAHFMHDLSNITGLRAKEVLVDYAHKNIS